MAAAFCHSILSKAGWNTRDLSDTYTQIPLALARRMVKAWRGTVMVLPFYRSHEYGLDGQLMWSSASQHICPCSHCGTNDDGTWALKAAHERARGCTGNSIRVQRLMAGLTGTGRLRRDESCIACNYYVIAAQ